MDLPEARGEGTQDARVDANGDAHMAQTGTTGGPLAKSEEKEEDSARAWLEETRLLAGSH